MQAQQLRDMYTRLTHISSHIVLSILSSNQAIGALEHLVFTPLKFLKHYYFDSVKHCLYLHHHCFIVINLDGLFEVKKSKSSCNKLI